MAGILESVSRQTSADERFGSWITRWIRDMDVPCKIASTQSELECAFRLTYQAYLRQGIQAWNPYGMRITPHHLLSTTEVFVRRVQGEVSSTVSLILDGRLGLPLETVFAKPIADRRRDRIVLAEASCLASSKRRVRGILGFLSEYGHLMRVLVQFARHRGVQQLLAAVHPRHARFYIRHLGFELLDVHEAYPGACNRPAVALSLDFERIDRNPPRCYDAFFGQHLPSRLLQPQPMPQSCREYFRDKLEQWSSTHKADRSVSMFGGVALE